MIRTLTNNWLLLAVCGVLEAMISAIYLIIQHTDGPIIFYSWNAAVAFAGRVALAAGACTIATATWKSATGRCWLLVLNGLALCALGLLHGFVRFRISFLAVSLLIILMAMSMGGLELAIARSLNQRGIAARWFLAVAAASSIGFALAFLALGFRWIKIEAGSHADFLLLGSYFGFSAICKLGLAWRLKSQGLSQSGQSDALSPFGNPRHAH